MQDLRRPQTGGGERGREDPWVRLRRAGLARDRDLVDEVGETERRKHAAHPRVEIRYHEDADAGRTESGQERCRVGVDAPGRGAREEGEQIVEIAVEVGDRRRGEDLADDRMPPRLLARAQIGRRHGRKGERRGGVEGRTEATLEDRRFGLDAVARRDHGVELADRTHGMEERARRVERDRTERARRGAVARQHARHHEAAAAESSGCSQNWISTPKAERGEMNTVSRPSGARPRSVMRTPSRSSAATTGARRSTSIEMW